jgi:hypothetical protein
MMSRRALTMIELLLALGLLSMLMAGLGWWVQSAARSSVSFGAPARWQVGAESTLQLIHDDIACGDFSIQDKDREAPSRVVLVDGALLIETRNEGEAIHRYSIDPSRDRITLNINAHNHEQDRVLLERVEGFEPTFDAESGTLTITIVSIDGDSAKRRYLLP